MKSMLLIVGVLMLSLLRCWAQTEADHEITRAHECLRSAATYAIQEADKALFEALLKSGLQINKPLNPETQEYALHEAVSRGLPDMVEYLLKHGANPLLRDTYGHRPIDNMNRKRDGNIEQLLTALERKPTEHDKKLLMEIPVPVWHEILGEPPPAPDPLAFVEASDAKPWIPFVSINDEDPDSEMTPVLNAHFPGWLPRSRVEEVRGGANGGSVYRDTKTHARGELVEIKLGAASFKNAPLRREGKLAVLARAGDLPAYQFQIRHATGPVMSGSGWRGYVVLISGYWVKLGTEGWDE